MDRVIAYPLTRNFIKELADWLEAGYISTGKDLSSLAIVFGGKRPALFLNKELSRRMKKGFSSPAFFTIDEFVDSVLSYGPAYSNASDLDACFEIYKLAKLKAKDILKGRESFSAFLPWAREILSFIEQLDLEDIEAESLKNIESLAAVGYDVPESINLLLGRITSLRGSFHEVMGGKKSYVRGLKYLLASKLAPCAEFAQFENILFCNFFYLHKTEESIIKCLYDKNKASLFFQGSEDDWPVLKKTARSFGVAIRPEKDVAPSYKIAIRPAFDLHSEVSMVREVLNQGVVPDETAVVLPDPQAVVPLLSEIASCVHEFNISMGYPLTRSSVYSLFSSIYRAQETKKEGLYYSKDYLRLLNHPLVKSLDLASDPALTRVLVHKIEEIVLGIDESDIGGSLFVSLKDIESLRHLYSQAIEAANSMGINATHQDLKKMVEELHRLLFTLWEGAENFSGFADSISEFFEFLSKSRSLEKYPLNISIVDRLLEMADEFKSSAFAQERFSKDDLFKITRDRLEHELIRFSGSPLKGLQVLGILETRSLSFDNVLIMDVNESVMPRLKIYEPLIPRDVMIALGINRLEKEEEIQRYQFFRLISSAKNVILFYRESKDLERSRFIEELIWEKQKKEKKLITLEPELCAGFSVEVLPRRIFAPKDKKYCEFLKETRFSATSVNTYLSCPLRFYYQYVLGLREKEELSDEPEAREVGTFVHELLEGMFSRFVRVPFAVDQAFKNDFFEALDIKFEKEFKKKMKSDAFLVREVLRFRLKNFLENEERRTVREVVCVEKVFEGSIRAGAHELRFKSKIDRIDRLEDGSLLILDYKTGSSDMMPSSVDKIESKPWTRLHLKRTIRSFQLPLYLYFVERAYTGADLNAGFYNLKDQGRNFGIKTFFDKEEPAGQRVAKSDCLMKALEFICLEILSPETPFEADQEDPYYCGICPFFNLCR